MSMAKKRNMLNNNKQRITSKNKSKAKVKVIYVMYFYKTQSVMLYSKVQFVSIKRKQLTTVYSNFIQVNIENIYTIVRFQ